MNLNRNEVATTHTKLAGRFECCHQASLHWSLLQSSIRQYMGSWQVHTCILFYGLVCSHGGSARCTSPQPDEVSSIVASMDVLGPSPGGWRWQPWCSVEIYMCWWLCIVGKTALLHSLLSLYSSFYAWTRQIVQSFQMPLVTDLLSLYQVLKTPTPL